jgi:hypothetical protein
MSQMGIFFLYVNLFLTIVEILQHVISNPHVRTTFFLNDNFFGFFSYLKNWNFLDFFFNVLSLTNFTYYWKFSLILKKNSN